MKAIFIILAILMVTQAFKMTSKVNTKLQSQIQSKFQSKNKLASTFQTSSQLKYYCWEEPYTSSITGCSTSLACYEASDCSVTGNDQDKCNNVGQNMIDKFFELWGVCINDYETCLQYVDRAWIHYSDSEFCGCTNPEQESAFRDAMDCLQF
uniref:Mating pheromone 3 n=2 Tax=Euplotoides octocarinatus TaxID=2716877 RepID=MER3_EUPOC|nr:RecName: Full=Mating pheromone 3; Flags: Precursor [Euplotes octocarinatus]CAD27435.1 pheromone 3 precursor [Euplotes octocarinatus]